MNHLSIALADDTVRNIAITGRYGAGKSSVLEEFARRHHKRVLFLSLSTLGPEERERPAQGVAPAKYPTTNQIQKELVKQLLHREPPAKLPQSRYQRIERLSLSTALAQAVFVLTAIGTALWLFGAWPNIPELTNGDHPVWLRFSAAALATVTLVSIVTWIRLAVHNRLEISQVSAAGTSVTLAKKSESYFDQYLDEIVYYFECQPKIDVVVFEDLDRFNEAGIFEALRELNTLLNSSRQITLRPFGRGGKRTIRFVYALRDSIFEQLGHDTKDLTNDAAQAEAVRANRTKFFDLVVPIVPFITHRTARELLSKVLADPKLAPVPPVSDDLVDLAARHLPDMRLLTNIRNEYAIFAERLIDSPGGMETLTPDKLFAMVVYKNLHLEDFELVQLGRSRLDSIYRRSRELVSENLTVQRAKLGKVTDRITIEQALQQQAATWGSRLRWFAEKTASATIGGTVSAYRVDDGERTEGDLQTPDFWEGVVASGNRIGFDVYSSSYGTRNRVDLTIDDLASLLGHRFRPEDWSSEPKERVEQHRREILDDLNTLRTADFMQLAHRPDFTHTVDGIERTFQQIVEAEVPSALGRSLINDGYIDRYYNLYMAQYYGERLPVNAMSFIVQNVDTNAMDVDYPFVEAEIVALLKETKRSFFNDASAYNIAILDHLLNHNDVDANKVLDNIIRQVGDNERAFIDAYISEAVHADKAVTYLSARWSDIFVELVEHGELPLDRRTRLVDAALAAAGRPTNYHLTESVCGFLQEYYDSFNTIAVNEVAGAGDEENEMAVQNALGVLGVAGFQCPDLTRLTDMARALTVQRGHYTLTSPNLHSALQYGGPFPLDTIRRINPDVYREVLKRPAEYLRALDNESANDVDSPGSPSNNHEFEQASWTISDPAALVSILKEFEDVEVSAAATLISRANPAALVQSLPDVPSRLWRPLAESRRFPATLENLDAYTQYMGEVDVRLAGILVETARISIPEPTNATEDDAHEGQNPENAEDELRASKIRVAEYLLHAGAAIPSPRKRVELVASLGFDGTLPVERVPNERGELLASLLEHRVCSDSAATFAHFDLQDWHTLRPAIQHSEQFAQFVTPDLLPPNTLDALFTNDSIATAVKDVILTRLDEFVSSDDKSALHAAAQAALVTDNYPGAVSISTITKGTANGPLATQLVQRFRESMTVDEALDAVLQAGGEYARLTTPGDKLVFPRDIYHENFLQRLKAEYRIKSRAFPESMSKDARIEVEVL